MKTVTTTEVSSFKRELLEVAQKEDLGITLEEFKAAIEIMPKEVDYVNKKVKFKLRYPESPFKNGAIFGYSTLVHDWVTVKNSSLAYGYMPNYGIPYQSNELTLEFECEPINLRNEEIVLPLYELTLKELREGLVKLLLELDELQRQYSSNLFRGGILDPLELTSQATDVVLIGGKPREPFPHDIFPTEAVVFSLVQQIAESPNLEFVKNVPVLKTPNFKFVNDVLCLKPRTSEIYRPETYAEQGRIKRLKELDLLDFAKKVIIQKDNPKKFLTKGEVETLALAFLKLLKALNYPISQIEQVENLFKEEGVF